MKKRLAALAATAMLAGGFTLAAPSVAQADGGGDAASSARPGGCVTRGEFRRAKKGMTKARVAKVFGTKGKRAAISSGGGYTFEIRSYKTCTPYGAVSIGFENGKLSNKTGIF